MELQTARTSIFSTVRTGDYHDELVEETPQQRIMNMHGEDSGEEESDPEEEETPLVQADTV